MCECTTGTLTRCQDGGMASQRRGKYNTNELTNQFINIVLAY
jgi:hypothetical protein